MDEDFYKINAKYYDAAYGSTPDLVDLPFYLEQAMASGGPVLEIGCGTGRISREIGKMGIPYQNLINLYLSDCAKNHKKLKLDWA